MSDDMLDFYDPPSYDEWKERAKRAEAELQQLTSAYHARGVVIDELRRQMHNDKLKSEAGAGRYIKSELTEAQELSWYSSTPTFADIERRRDELMEELARQDGAAESDKGDCTGGSTVKTQDTDHDPGCPLFGRAARDQLELQFWAGSPLRKNGPPIRCECMARPGRRDPGADR